MLLVTICSILLATPAPAKMPKAGDEMTMQITKDETYVFCWIPPGDSTLGTPVGKPAMKDVEVEHKYHSNGYWLGKHLVTQSQWKSVMGVKPQWNHFRAEKKDIHSMKNVDNTDQFPCDSISYNDAEDFIDSITKYNKNMGGTGIAGKVVLPSDDQWEYSCRGGKNDEFYTGNILSREMANFGNNLGRPSPVGSYIKYAQHVWGLTDMHGNVWQWTSSDSVSKNGNKCLRGGSWKESVTMCRSACKIDKMKEYRSHDVGFRLCIEPVP